MPATPDVLDDDDLDPWSGALERGFVIEDALVSGAFEEVRAAGGRIVRSRLDRVGLTGARLRSLALTDVVAGGLEASGADWSGATLRRVAIAGARLGGLQLIEATAEDVVFRDCRLELATFRGAKLRNVRLRALHPRRGRLPRARALQSVRFDGCRLLRADFTVGVAEPRRPARVRPRAGGRRGRPARCDDRLDPARRPRSAARAGGRDHRVDDD